MLYLKIMGTETLGWQLIGAAVSGGGGGGGTAQIVRYSGDPNGHVSMNGPGMLIDVSVSPPNIWIKQTSGTANDEWILLIGG